MRSPLFLALLVLLSACTSDWSLPTRDSGQAGADAARIDPPSGPLTDAATPAPGASLDGGSSPVASNGGSQPAASDSSASTTLMPRDGGQKDAAQQVPVDAARDSEAAVDSCGDCPRDSSCAARGACACPDGGVPPGCADPCASAGCGMNARCSLVDGGAHCSCDSKYTGDGFTCLPEVDRCVPNPCPASLTCVPAGSTHNCVSACSPSCGIGAPCGQDADCGDEAVCDRLGNVCVRPCTSRTIFTRADVTAAKFCSEISGDLIFQTSFEEVTAADFPHLRRVFGAIKGGPDSRLTLLTLPALLTVDGDVNLYELPALQTVSMPVLTTIGTRAKASSLVADPRGIALLDLSMPNLVQVYGDVQINQLMIERIDLGNLQMVNGSLGIVFLQRLSTLKLGALKRVNGTFALSVLLRLPYSQISYLDKAGDTPMFSDIGCCNAGSDKYMCNGAYECE